MALWTLGAAVSERNPVFVRAEDKSELLLHLSQGAGPCPSVVEVKPNGEACLPLLEFLHGEAELATSWQLSGVATTATPSAYGQSAAYSLAVSSRDRKFDRLRGTRLGQVDRDFRPLLRSARDVIIAINFCSAAAATQAAELLELTALEQQAISIENCHPQTAAIANLLKNLANELLLPMEQGVLFSDATNDLINRSWWTKRSNLIAVCSALRTELHSIGLPAQCRIATNLGEWLDAIRIHISQMNAHVVSPVVFEKVSAWFMGASLRHIECAHAGWAILFLHRSVEWLLVAKATSLGLIDFARKPGGVYRPWACTTSDDKLGFGNHMDILSSRIQFHNLRDLFNELNGWRNVLPYTHHMSVALDEKARKLIFDIVAGLPKFAASTTWLRAAEAFARPPPIEVEDLIDPDNLLRSAFSVVV